LYDSTDFSDFDTHRNPVVNWALMPLQWLGMRTVMHDVAKGLPPDCDPTEYRGIVTWFWDDTMSNAAAYCAWLKRQSEHGIRIAMMGRLGADIDAMTKEPIDTAARKQGYAALGLTYVPLATTLRQAIEAVSVDPAMAQFERKDKGVLPYYDFFRAGKDARRYVVLRRRDVQNSDSDVVCVTDRGGFALHGYDLFSFDDGRAQWRIDPFRFFAEALAIDPAVPVADPTTLFGKRVLYSHIDGDGFRNITEIDSVRTSAEVIYTEIIAKRDIPVTASFIAAEVDPRYFGNERFRAIARTIAAAPNVEIGVHGYSHPLIWSRRLTAFALAGFSTATAGTGNVDAKTESMYEGLAYADVPEDVFLRKEIDDAVAYVGALVAPKRPAVYQWTGDCRPQPEALRKVDALRLGAINGGDSRMDPFFPSYAGVAPWWVDIGGISQVYTSQSNENIYTNGWTGPFYGFEHVVKTMTETERPTLADKVARRVSAIGVYYHYYSAQNKDGLKALQRVYDFATAQDVTPVFTSRYIAAVQGARGMSTSLERDGGYTVRDYGACMTLRVSAAAGYPLVSSTSNVLGYDDWEGHRYIHLGVGGYARVILRNTRPDATYVRASSADIRVKRMTGDEIRFAGMGWGKAAVTFGGMTPQSVWEGTMRLRGSAKIRRFSVRVDAWGSAVVDLPAGAAVYVSLKKKGGA
jgi:hypothetical protein